MNALHIHKTIVVTNPSICNGIATLISFSTPDGDVNGVEPVKFIALKELIVTAAKHSDRAERKSVRA